MTITAEHAYKVGRVLGWYFGGAGKEKCRAVIGKDTRLSSYMLEYALAAGLTASGADAYILHVTTTPSVSYIARCDGFDCGIMISASHNPYGDNGIKLMNGQGEKLDDGAISLIERYLDGDFTAFGGDIPLASGSKIGRTVDYIAGRNRYIGHLISLSTCSYKGLRVGLDMANGSAFMIAKSLFEALGARTYVIGASPNGVNVNEGVGSTNVGALKELVRENGLDIGFAFDGDADRCIAVDERGNELTGDEIMYVCANYMKQRGELTGDKIVCTVMSNGGLIKSLQNLGISCVLCDVGDRNVCEKMAAEGVVLGGERSGHVVFSKLETTGDGLVTAIMVMEALVESKCHISRLVEGYKPFAQEQMNIRTDDKIRAMRGIAEAAERIRRELEVRLVVRPSGTEPLVRIMAEGESPEKCALACRYLGELIRENCD